MRTTSTWWSRRSTSTSAPPPASPSSKAPTAPSPPSSINKYSASSSTRHFGFDPSREVKPKFTSKDTSSTVTRTTTSITWNIRARAKPSSTKQHCLQPHQVAIILPLHQSMEAGNTQRFCYGKGHLDWLFGSYCFGDARCLQADSVRFEYNASIPLTLL